MDAPPRQPMSPEELQAALAQIKAAQQQQQQPESLVRETRPDWALGRERVGGFQSVASPEVSNRRFAAPDVKTAWLNNVETALDAPVELAKTHAQRLRDYMAKTYLGVNKDVTQSLSPEGKAQIKPEQMQNLALDWFVPGAGMFGAVKPKGGMWHPEAVERLAEPLYSALTRDAGSPLAYRELVKMHEAGINYIDGSPYTVLQKTAGGVDRMLRNYLNKHAGTATDPLKDIELPSGQRWEAVTDKLIKADKYSDRGAAEIGAKPGESVWSLEGPSQLSSYLSHVGDYLHQNVDPVKLQQYDLVRAVKETAANDARVAREMEKAAAASTKDLPVHKEYPDGMRWVELRKPEALTPEQAKSIRPMTSKELKREIEGDMEMAADYVPGEHVGYVAIDHKGNPIQNSYSQSLAAAGTPEEAWLAGRLSEEGNQMGHCVGGYCEGVAAGESRIYSLRDAKGRSHVTVEVEPVNYEKWKGFNQDRVPINERTEQPDWSQLKEDAGFKEWAAQQAPSIRQIKGKQNRAPVAEYLPYVQDFVKSGKWGEVGDLQNTGLHKRPDGTYGTVDFGNLLKPAAAP